jgi:MFS family permease
MSFTSPDHRPRWRDFGIAVTARSVSYCGDYLAATALALTLQTRGDNGYGVAALMIAAALPVALLGTAGGWIADRVDSRKILVVTGALQAAVCLALAYTNSPFAMVALVAVVSTGLAITQPTLSALTPDMVGRPNLARASAISQTASSVGFLLGPALGGFLVGTYGARLPLLADAATYLALTIAGLAIQTRRGGRRTVAIRQSAAGSAADANVAKPASQPWLLRNDRLLVTLILSMGGSIAAVSAVAVAELFFVRDTLGGSATMYGVVGAVWTAGMLVGAWPWTKARGDDRRMVLLALLALIALGVVVLASSGVPAAPWLIPIYLVGGGLNAGLNVIAGVVAGRRVPAPVRGRVFGVFAAVSNGANMIGFLAGGLLMASVAPRIIMIGTGVAGIVVASLFLPAVLRARAEMQDTTVEVGQPAPAAVG